jgi:Lipase (class 3)
MKTVWVQVCLAGKIAQAALLAMHAYSGEEGFRKSTGLANARLLEFKPADTQAYVAWLEVRHRSLPLLQCMQSVPVLYACRCGLCHGGASCRCDYTCMLHAGRHGGVCVPGHGEHEGRGDGRRRALAGHSLADAPLPWRTRPQGCATSHSPCDPDDPLTYNRLLMYSISASAAYSKSHASAWLPPLSCLTRQSQLLARAGFMRQFASVTDVEHPERHIGLVMNELSNASEPTRVLCCGHSLGGALATLGAAWVRSRGLSQTLNVTKAARCCSSGPHQALILTGMREIASTLLCLLVCSDIYLQLACIRARA